MTPSRIPKIKCPLCLADSPFYYNRFGEKLSPKIVHLALAESKYPCIYAIEFPNGKVKAGYSRNLQRRVNDITNNAWQYADMWPRRVAYIETPFLEDAEYFMHYILSDEYPSKGEVYSNCCFEFVVRIMCHAVTHEEYRRNHKMPPCGVLKGVPRDRPLPVGNYWY